MFDYGCGAGDFVDSDQASATEACHGALSLIEQGVAMLNSAELWRLGDRALRELVVGQRRLQSRVDHAGLRVLAALDARLESVPGAAAGRAGATLLVQALNTAPAAAHRDVAAARLMHPEPERSDPVAREPGGSDQELSGSDQAPGASSASPQLSGAYGSGEITRGHVDVVTSVFGRIPRRLLRAVDEQGVSGAARVDSVMTDLSRQVPPRSVERAARYLLELLDPDGRDRFDPEADQRRELTFHRDSTGMLVGRFQLDQAAGLVFTTAVNAFSAQPSGTCETEDLERSAMPDTRSRAQRQADALASMARSALVTGPNVAGDRPHLLIVAGVEDIVAAAMTPAVGAAASTETAPTETAPTETTSTGAVPAEAASARPRSGDTASVASGAGAGAGAAFSRPRVAATPGGEPLSPSAVALFGCDSVLRRVLRAPSGAVLELGRSVRTASAAQRKALAARDRGCAAPCCTVPAGGCEAHHVTWWSRGGATDVDNLVLVCPRHHANIHQGHWSVQLRDGVPWMRAPRWADPEQKFRRNTSHEVTARADALGRQLLLAVSDRPPPTPPRDTPPPDTPPPDVPPNERSAIPPTPPLEPPPGDMGYPGAA